MLRNPALVSATLAGSALFFAFMGAFSYIDFRLEAPPFSLTPAVSALVFLVWVMGAAGPVAGREADRRGWRARRARGPGLAAAGVALSLLDVLALALAGLALITLGNFSGVTAAQLGVADSTAQDRGLASALYFSAYYVAGALGSYLPGPRLRALGVGRRRAARARAPTRSARVAVVVGLRSRRRLA